MRELLLTLGILLLLALIAVAANLSFEASLLLSMVLMAVGFGIGIPTALVYHTILYRGLERQGEVPRHWFFKPVALHQLIDDPHYKRMMPWFITAVGSFTMVVGGIIVVVTGMVSGLLR